MNTFDQESLSFLRKQVQSQQLICGGENKTFDMINPASVIDLVEKPCATPASTAFGHRRLFFENRFVYTVISPRTRGLSIGINMNPDQSCNFDCVYCEVARSLPAVAQSLDVGVMAEELEKTLSLVQSGGIREHPACRSVSSELLQLRQVALSGDGEPTLCPNFTEAIEAVVHVRARRTVSCVKLALITNGSRLDSRAVRKGLRCLTPNDEIWIKLDAGTQTYMERVNRSEVPLEKVIENMLLVGRQRPIIIQSLFSLIHGQGPPPQEIDEYIHRLRDLKRGGAQISLVQIYSATRPMAHDYCGHLPLKEMSRIRQRIKAETGLRAEVF
ncbi:MAG: hypothetical protein ABSA83_15060 [Verrucomicrobiota bacterium]